MKLESLGD